MELKEKIEKEVIPQLTFCKQCSHRDVCKKIEEPKTTCEHFTNIENYKTYGSIYNMFQPIFNWLKIHYPSGEVKFLVDQTSATMYFEHGKTIFDIELTKPLKEILKNET